MNEQGANAPGISSQSHEPEINREIASAPEKSAQRVAASRGRNMELYTYLLIG